MNNQQKYLILYNLRSTYNVGAIFRTAEAVGMTKIYLIGTSPRPVDEYKRLNHKIIKTALGAEKVMNWEYKKTSGPLLNKFKKNKIELIALEQDIKACDYKQIKPKGDWALIVGEETKGLPKKILDQVDLIAEIPMVGIKESLNVSVATGIALFKFLE